MSLQQKLLAGATLATLVGLGWAQSASASPLPEQADQLISQAIAYDMTNPVYNDDGTARIPAEVISVFSNEYIRLRLPNGDTRLVSLADDAFDTRRITPGDDVILTMQGDRIVGIMRATDEDLLALVQEQQARQEALRAEIAAPETIVQTERVETTEAQVEERTQVAEERRAVTSEAATPVPAPTQPVRALW